MTKDICIDIVKRYLHSDNADIRRDFESLMNVLFNCDDYADLLETEMMLDGDDEPCAVSDAIVARYATLIINSKKDIVDSVPEANWKSVYNYRNGLYRDGNEVELLNGLDVTDIPTQVAILYYKHLKMVSDKRRMVKQLKKMDKLITKNQIIEDGR